MRTMLVILGLAVVLGVAACVAEKDGQYEARDFVTIARPSMIYYVDCVHKLCFARVNNREGLVQFPCPESLLKATGAKRCANGSARTGLAPEAAEPR
jgi:hypothetical protein